MLFRSDNIPTRFVPAGGGTRTTDGYSTVTINLPGAATQARVRITGRNDNNNELWCVDDVRITGTAPTTITQLTNGIATSPLTASQTNKAILGFSASSTSTPNFTAINIQNTQTPTGRYTNPKIYRSTDNDYSTAGDNTLVASGTISGTQLQFSGFSEALSGTAKNYFIVVDVDASVTGSTAASQPSFSCIVSDLPGQIMIRI